MKAVTKYETTDGKVFDSKAEAKAHSDVLELTAEIEEGTDGASAHEVAAFLLKKYRMLPLLPKAAKEEAASAAE